MKKVYRGLLCIVMFSNGILLNAQNTITYNDTFTVDVSYEKGHSQWDNWTKFRSSLDTTTNNFYRVSMKGTYDVSGHICSEAKLVKQIALMLKNNTSNSVTCNGITWKAGTVGDGVEFSSDGTLNKCAKKGGYSLRPQMGSSRWGGINTGSCGNISQRMMVVFDKVSKPDDAGVSSIKTTVCSNVITVNFNNFGSSKIDSLAIGWSVNGTIQKVNNYYKSIASLGEANLNLSSNYDFKDGQSYIIKAWTIQTNNNDPYAANDTSIIGFKYIAPPDYPITVNNTLCGIGKASLQVVSVNSTDSIDWYDAETGGNLIGNGKEIMSPALNFGINTFYAEASKLLNNSINCINPVRTPLKVTVNPRPSGAAFIKGTDFISTQLNTTGTYSNPDIVAANDVLTYEIMPPDGYTNSGYNKTWKAAKTELRTRTGRILHESYFTFTSPLGSKNGIITFKPDSLLTDTSIVLALTINDNVCDSILTRYIFVAPRPVVNFDFTKSVCNGDTVFFTNQSMVSSGNMVYHWDFGTEKPADTSSIANPKFIFPAHGIFNVTLTAKSIPYGYVNSQTIQVEIKETPKIGFNIINACIGDSVNFVNTTTISTGNINYKWDFGAGINSDKVNIKHAFSKVGGFDVTLNAASNGCHSFLTKKAHQFVRPVANFDFTGNCSHSVISFKNLTTIVSNDQFGSHWEFGDGTVNNRNNPTHVYTSGGNIKVKYVAKSQFACTDSIIKIIFINPSPEASFTTGPVCNVKPVVFTNTTPEPYGVSTTYLWNFEDGKVIGTKNTERTFTNIGPQFISLKAIGDNGCSTTIQKTINVNQQPVANFEATDACAGDNMIFTNITKGSGVISYQWQFGDGTTSSDFNPIKKYSGTKASTYNITLTATNVGGCEDAITLPININEKPTCKFAFKSTRKGGLEYSFTPENGSYSNYHWSFEGGGNSDLANPTHSFPTNGKYRVSVMMKTAAGCDCVDSSQFISINTLGNKTLNANSGISFYPNPNNGSFTINLSNSSSSDQFILNITDINGKILMNETLQGNTIQKVTYDNLANGMYIIKIVKPNGERTSGKLNIIK